MMSKNILLKLDGEKKEQKMIRDNIPLTWGRSREPLNATAIINGVTIFAVSEQLVNSLRSV